MINSDLTTESRQEFFKLFPAVDNKFVVDDIRYVASKKYPELGDLTNVPKNEIEKIISVKDLTKKDKSLSQSQKLSTKRKAQWEDPHSGYNKPEYTEKISATAAAKKQEAATSEIAKINANPDLRTASYIDTIHDPAVKWKVRNEFSDLFPDLYHGSFESKAAEQAFAKLQKLDPEIEFGRGHLVQKMLGGEFKEPGLKIDRPHFPTAPQLNNYHDVFNSFLSEAKMRRTKAIKEQRWDNVKTIEDNMMRVEKFITDLFL